MAKYWALSVAEASERRLAQRRAFASMHTIIEVLDGAFVSLIDPPQNLRELARSCANQGAWPVLVGKQGDTDAVLSSPIILYDYPEVAPQSPGDLFDGTEIDEILTLRILAMSPKPGGDIMDLALRDKLAIIQRIERDFEDRVHVAVTLLGDPGRDLGSAGFPGHRFYFAQEEIEPIGAGDRP